MSRTGQPGSLAVMAVAAAALCACPQSGVKSGGDAGKITVAGSSELNLMRVGPGTLNANGGDTVTLTCLLVRSTGSATQAPTPVSRRDSHLEAPRDSGRRDSRLLHDDHGRKRSHDEQRQDWFGRHG